MSIDRQKDMTGKTENAMGVRRGKWIHALAVMLFCMILSIGTVAFADEVPATVIVAGAKIRATADTSSEALAGVKSGDTLSICGQTTGADGNVWYQVYIDANTKGFIRSDLIQKNADGNISTVPNQNANTSTTTNTNTTETQATAVEKKSATVTTNGVRIRKGASTSHDVVATANRGMVLTITGEAAGGDGKTWYQVSFSYNNKEITGFIRSDLVTFENVPADTVVSEITGTEETPEETTTEAATEPVTEEQSQPQETQQEAEDENANIILMNVEEEVYVLPEFTPIILKWQDQNINAFKNGKFYLFYAQKQNGETGWYLYDSEKGVYQRYVYDTADAVIPENSAFSGSTLPVIILVVVIVILLLVIGLMFFKLREYTSEYYEDDEEDDDEEGDEEEELEEEEPEEEEPVQKPLKRPERPQSQNRPQQGGGQQPPRRPQPNGNGQPPRRSQQEGGETVRHPQQSGNGQPVRRQPAEQPKRPQSQENGQLVRRPQQNGNGQPVRRQPSEQPKRPTQQQNRPPKGNQQLQNGRKAKNFLDAEDDDMEFIDI